MNSCRQLHKQFWRHRDDDNVAVAYRAASSFIVAAKPASKASHIVHFVLSDRQSAIWVATAWQCGCARHLRR